MSLRKSLGVRIIYIYLLGGNLDFYKFRIGFSIYVIIVINV